MFRKIVSVMLSLVLVAGLAIPAFAADNHDSSSVDGMDQFMELTAEGLISFDEAAAVSSGYHVDVVTKVATYIAGMNELVMNGVAYIDESMSAVVYLRGTRAVGESKVVYHWYGLTEIYMNSDEADDLIANLNSTTNVTNGNLATIFGAIIGGWVSYALTGMTIGLTIYRWQVEQAASYGTGIIMYIQYDLVTSMQSIWFGPQ